MKRVSVIGNPLFLIYQFYLMIQLYCISIVFQLTNFYKEIFSIGVILTNDNEHF